jgi:hypothetical protein
VTGDAHLLRARWRVVEELVISKRMPLILKGWNLWLGLSLVEKMAGAEAREQELESDGHENTSIGWGQIAFPGVA